MRRLLLTFVLLASPVAAQTGTVVFRDTFTEACELCTIELTTHVPDLGGAWVLNENTGAPSDLWKVAGYRDWLSPMSAKFGIRVSYLAQMPPGVTLSTDYVIKFALDDDIGCCQGSFGGPLLRRTAFNTFYALGMRPRAYAVDCYLYKRVAGVNTILAQGNCDFTGDNGTGDTVEFGAIGS